MTADQTCKNCRWWIRRECQALDNLPDSDRARAFSVLITVADDHNLDWRIITGPDFGCVHFEAKE